MLVDFLENPQTKVVNIFFEEDQKISKKYIGNSSSYLQIRKKMKIFHKNIIFLLINLSKLKSFIENLNFQVLKNLQFIAYTILIILIK